MISLFLSIWRNFASLAIQNVPSEDSCRLIWIFAGRMTKSTFSNMAAHIYGDYVFLFQPVFILLSAKHDQLEIFTYFLVHQSETSTKSIYLIYPKYLHGQAWGTSTDPQHAPSDQVIHYLLLIQLHFFGASMGSQWVYSNFWSKMVFVCVEVLWPNQPNGVMSSMVSLPNHTFTG